MCSPRSKTWVPRMAEVAKLVATWSKDPNRQVGAVITTEDFRILSTGFNGYPAGFNDKDQTNKNKKTIHAEMNALLALRHHPPNMKMFVYGGHPCSQCAAAICQSGISTLYCAQIDYGSSWLIDMNVARDLFIEHPTLDYLVLGVLST